MVHKRTTEYEGIVMLDGFWRNMPGAARLRRGLAWMVGGGFVH